MRIAFISPFLPYPPDNGIKIRDYYLLRGLASHHEVDLVTPSYTEIDEGVQQVESLGAKVYIFRHRKKWNLPAKISQTFLPTPLGVNYFAPTSTVTQVQEMLRRGAYDLLYVDEMFLAPYAWGIADVPKILSRTKIDYSFYGQLAKNSASTGQKLLSLIEYHKTYRYEKRVWLEFRKGIVCSPREKELVMKIAPDVDLLVAPNGVDTRLFAFDEGKEREVPVLLFVGTMSYQPNIDGVLYFLREVYPRIIADRDEVEIWIVGHDPPLSIQLFDRDPRIKVTGSVSDVQPYYRGCTAVIVPLRIGGGTRLKIAEAMAIGRPVISTPIGCEGLEVRHEEHLLIAEGPEEFAQQTLRLLDEPGLRKRLVENGRRLVEERYSWSTIAAQVEEFCIEAVTAG